LAISRRSHSDFWRFGLRSRRSHSDLWRFGLRSLGGRIRTFQASNFSLPHSQNLGRRTCILSLLSFLPSCYWSCVDVDVSSLSVYLHPSYPSILPSIFGLNPMAYSSRLPSCYRSCVKVYVSTICLHPHTLFVPSIRPSALLPAIGAVLMLMLMLMLVVRVHLHNSFRPFPVRPAISPLSVSPCSVETTHTRRIRAIETSSALTSW
jgi:hypothetical protein